MKISASFADPSASAVNPAEQRRSTRYSSDFRISMLDVENRPADEAVRLINLSDSGVGIESSRRLAVGQRLGFELATGSGTPVSAQARVRWSQPSGHYFSYGLKLEDMGYFARMRLEKFLKPPVFGPLEWATLALEAGASMVVILIIADWLNRSPHVISALTPLLPVLLPALLLAGLVKLFDLIRSC
ncbi:MAG: PilZ domain-containing protein [Elusimicrobiota bacterium]